jgi:hypothetical protein
MKIKIEEIKVYLLDTSTMDEEDYLIDKMTVEYTIYSAVNKLRGHHFLSKDVIGLFEKVLKNEITTVVKKQLQ